MELRASEAGGCVAARLLACSLTPQRPQKLAPIFSSSTRGRSGTSDLMNCADEVNMLACELLRFVP